MAARWSRWCIAMRRRPRAEAPPLAPGAYALPAETASLFEPPMQRDYADPQPEVLHPDLLKKSSCHRKKFSSQGREKRERRGRAKGGEPRAEAAVGPEATDTTAAATTRLPVDEEAGAAGGHRTEPALWSRVAIACACAGAVVLLVWRGRRAR